MHKIIAAVACIMLGFATVPAAAADTVYVMRHLHKAAGDDPPLTEEGASLARLVAGQLGGLGIKAVFATATRRAAQTAVPLAQSLRIPVTTYEPRDVAGLVATVQAIRGNVLVVGHSNTVPDIVAALGGTRPEPISDTEYGTIYIVKAGSPDVRRMHVPPPPIPAAPERGR
jgi:broad specificity phosphatase PhoE